MLATPILVDSKFLGEFYFTSDAVSLARKLRNEGYYDEGRTIELPDGYYDGEEAAEEIFDLANNPMRQGDRLVRYGRGRSLSVGDMVRVDGEYFLCRPREWVKVEMVY